ncbi:hypothetical protein BH11MYX3_BH11MYX3_12060 [soil metagenome]
MHPLVLALLIVFAGCSRSEQSPAPAPAKASKDPVAARQLIAGGATVIDVRTPEEFTDGHLPQATNIPVDTVATRIADVDKLVGGDRAHAIVVYCAAGSRAAKAKVALEAAGFTHVVNGGGFDDLN